MNPKLKTTITVVGTLLAMLGAQYGFDFCPAQSCDQCPKAQAADAK